MSLVPLPTSVTENGKAVQVDARIRTIVVWIADTFSVKVSSGYRDAAHNAEVGGASNSDHLTGGAVDFVGPRISSLYQWALSAGFPYVEPMSDARNHVHISFIRGSQAVTTTPAQATTQAVLGAAGSAVDSAASAGGGCAPTAALAVLIVACLVDVGLHLPW